MANPAPVGPLRAACAADYSFLVLRGHQAIMGMRHEITELLDRTGQSDNPLLRLDFFLGRVALFPGNRPVALLVRSAFCLEGVVFLYEKTFCGIPTGYLRGFDHLTGESSVIAPEELRVSFLQWAVHHLFVKTSARVAWATVRIGVAEPIAIGEPLRHPRVEAGSASREYRLKLGDTFEAMLSHFGSHTRRNLRYYRRRAEKELEASFHPQLTVAESDEALQQLSKCSFQPFPVSPAEWRKMDGLLRTQPGYFAMGLRANGEWISYLVGVRKRKLTYVFIQMNHNGFARYSLSTVLRSYFFEHEIERGQEEVNFVNGTCALFQRWCEVDNCVTVSAHRGLAAFVIFHWIAPWHSAPDHALNMQRWNREHTNVRPAPASP